MRGDDRFVERDAETRRGRKRERAVDDIRDATGRLLYERRGEVVEVLEDLEVRRRRGEVDRRHRRHGTAHVVRGDEHVVRLGPRRELPRLGDAAHHREVGLDDVDRVQLEELAELVTDMDALPTRDRDASRASDLRHRLRVVGWDRLLDPAGAIRLELAGDRDRLRWREASVHLDEHLGIRARAFAHRFDERDRAAQLARGELLPGRPERIELQRAVAARDRSARGVAELGRRALDGVPAVRVRRDAVVDRAAEQSIHGHAERLADDVPARDLDHRERGHRDLSGARVVVADHPACERLERERIRADDVRRHRFLEVTEESARVVDHAHLAHALDPLVGADDDEREVAPGVAKHERADLDDLHDQPFSPVVTTPRTMYRCAAKNSATSGRT